MKLSMLGQVVVGVSIAFGGIATPIIQNYQSQQAQNQVSENWLQLTLEELAFYDGLMGRPAYIAYQGDIYDVTNAAAWSNGSHEGMHLAGQDCTDILSTAPHGTSVLKQLVVIGEIVNSSIGSSIVSSLDGSSSTLTSTPETCTWIEQDDARRLSRDRDEDDDHEDDEDEDEHDDENDEDDEDEYEDDEDEDEDDGYWYCTNGSNANTSNSPTSINTSLPNSPSQNGKYYLTLAELAYYDGTNGKPAWIAVYGNLYDVTHETAWKNGVHRGLHLGGKDASSAFDSSPHSQSLLNSLLHIGYLVSA
ncbi:MAG: cytochrome b5 domain-containing protein [Bacilli bacterium]